MPASYINTTGPLSIGSAAGSGQSFNTLRNYRNGATINTQTGVNEIATFFKTFARNHTLTTAPYRFSQFRGGEVFRVQINSFTNCSSNGPYHNQSDGVLSITVFGGSGGNFNLNGMTGNQIIPSGGTASWNNLEGSYSGNPTKGDYSLTIVDANTSYSITMALVRCFEAGYGTSYISYQSDVWTTGESFWNLN